MKAVHTRNLQIIIYVIERMWDRSPYYLRTYFNAERTRVFPEKKIQLSLFSPLHFILVLHATIVGTYAEASIQKD